MRSVGPWPCWPAPTATYASAAGESVTAFRGRGVAGVPRDPAVVDACSGAGAEPPQAVRAAAAAAAASTCAAAAARRGWDLVGAGAGMDGLSGGTLRPARNFPSRGADAASVT